MDDGFDGRFKKKSILFIHFYFYFLALIIIFWFFFHLVKTNIDIVISILLLAHLNSVETHNQSNFLFIFTKILNTFFFIAGRLKPQLKLSIDPISYPLCTVQYRSRS